MSELRVLSITTGTALLEARAGGLLNAEQRRQAAMAELVDEYIVLTRTLGPARYAERRLWPNCTVYASHSASRLAFAREGFRTASELIRKHRINVVSARDPFLVGRLGVRLRRAHDVALVVHVMADMIGNPYFVRERLRNRVLQVVANRVLPHADIVRVSTTREKMNLDRLAPQLGLVPAQIHHVPFLVDLEGVLEADGRMVRRRYSGGARRPIVLFVGRLERQKDVATLLRAMAIVVERIRDTLLLVVGDGTERAKLERLAQTLGIAKHVAFTGRVDHDELGAYYGGCDVFAITSIYEGTCMVLVEAAAAGKPIVATDFAGARDAIVDGESGFIVPIGDELAVAERILYLLEHEERRGFGDRGREHALAAFNRGEVLAKTRALWTTALERRGGAGNP
ncbi:MAG: glycosyltransferase [Verrucomicrobia bacterium]|nr:glycosyltransferase [Verrucomicrobiota bacterium]